VHIKIVAVISRTIIIIIIIIIARNIVPTGSHEQLEHIEGVGKVIFNGVPACCVCVWFVSAYVYAYACGYRVQ
jgi:uncharacterized membrane-anchored protein